MYMYCIRYFSYDEHHAFYVTKMAAPIRKTFHRKFQGLLNDKSQIGLSNRDNFSNIRNRSFQTRSKFFPMRISLKGGVLGTLAVAGAVTLGNLAQKSIRIHAAVNERLQLKPSREVCKNFAYSLVCPAH